MNIPRGTHAIIIDCRDEFTVYDPNNGKIGRKYYKSSDDDISWSGVIEVIDAKEMRRSNE